MIDVEPLTVVAPSSVEAWYPRFANGSNAIFIGENSDVPADRLAASIADASLGRPIRILSGHDSLIRDYVVANQLRAAGHQVACQSGLACAAGIDKILQKRLLVADGIHVPRWGMEHDPPSGAVLRKRRESTQSRGLCWLEDGSPGDTQVYWEEFVTGVEYSVVLHRQPNATTFFPVVWKGAARTDLRPPWRRLRTVPSGLSPQNSRTLQDIARRIAVLLDSWGFLEVEFIAAARTTPLVIDVNPRLSGTTRLVAMATRAPIFDWQFFDSAGDRYLETVRYAAEIPYAGPTIMERDVVATSRFTCSADDPDAVKDRLRLVGSLDAPHVDIWPGGWDGN